METDFLIIGSGVAGLSFALDVAKHGKVILVSKADIEETNTRYAQGGIASVTYNPDNFEKHVNDTLATGAGICDKETVNIVVKEAPARTRELVIRGVNFDKNREGKYDLGMEGGHSEARVLHHKDNTGYTIQKALSDQVKRNKNIHILENHFAVDIITQHHLGRLVRKD